MSSYIFKKGELLWKIKGVVAEKIIFQKKDFFSKNSSYGDIWG